MCSARREHHADAAVIGRVLDLPRQRASADPAPWWAWWLQSRSARPSSNTSVAAVALMARGSQYTYRTWTRRLATAYGDRLPGSISAGELTDLIAQHVVARQSKEDCRAPAEPLRRTPLAPTGTCGPTSSRRAAHRPTFA